MEWNPSSTALKGLEWGPTVSGGVVLDSITKAAAMSMRQTQGQSIGTARVWIGDIPTRGGKYVVEVYDNETAVTTAQPTTVTARPNQDISGMGTGIRQWRKIDGSPVNIYQNIDDPQQVPGQYILTFTQYPSWAGYNFAINTQALGLTTHRVLSVTMNVIANAYPINSFSIGLILNGVIQRGKEGTIYWRPQYLWSRTWTTNPYTGQPWTLADIYSLDSGSASNNVYISAGNTTGANVCVFQCWFDIVVQGPDNRLAFGLLDDSAYALTPNAWNEVTLLTPAGGTWTKDATGWHTYVVRRTSNVGSLVVPTLAAPSAPYSTEGWPSITLDSASGNVTAMGAVGPQAFGLIQRTTVAAESLDSQSYARQVDALIYNGQDAEQELSDLGVLLYGGVRAWVKPNGVTQPLLIKVRRRSDDVQMGQTITVTSAEVADLPVVNGWCEIDVQMQTGFTGAAATQYYLEFSSVAPGTGTDYWSVLALDTGNQGNAATFGGTTDRALVNGSEADRYEIATTLWTIPTTPIGFAATLDTQEQAEWTALDEEGCLPLVIEFVHLAWNATGLGGLFDYYELQRSDDAGVTWAVIGTIGQEATTTFDDYETPRGVVSQYRLRVWRTDAARSDWTATLMGPACAAVGAEMIFTTNANPNLNVTYNRDGSEEMEYLFLDSDDVVFQRIYGRDYQVAFLGTERRGVSFTVPLIVNAVRQPQTTREGVPLFTALRDLATADVPYVCVMDHWGNRWFAELQIPSGTHKEPGHIYIAQITVTEVRGTPSPVEVI